MLKQAKQEVKARISHISQRPERHNACVMYRKLQGAILAVKHAYFVTFAGVTAYVGRTNLHRVSANTPKYPNNLHAPVAVVYLSLRTQQLLLHRPTSQCLPYQITILFRL